MFACILLAAGESLRFGSPKALAELDGNLVISRLQASLLAAAVDEIIVVLGAHRQAVEPFILNHKKIKVVYNNHYKFGQTSSVQCGLLALSPRLKGFFLLPVDYPLIRFQTFNALEEAFVKEGVPIVIPAFAGRKGHPPLFSIGLKEAMLTLPNNQGLNTLAQQWADRTLLLEVPDEGVVLSFNDTQEFKIIQQKSRILSGGHSGSTD